MNHVLMAEAALATTNLTVKIKYLKSAYAALSKPLTQYSAVPFEMSEPANSVAAN